jgi:hypothetical protein
MVERFWGDFGYFEAALPVAVIVVATIVLVAVALVAFWPARSSSAAGHEHRRPSPRALLLFAAPVAFLAVLVLVRAYSLYLSSGRDVFIHGRYLFGAIVPLAVVVGVGATRIAGRWAPLAVTAWALVMQLAALQVTLRTWWGDEQASVRESLSAVVAWNPWPDGLAYAIALAGACLWVAAGWLASRPPRLEEIELG